MSVRAALSMPFLRFAPSLSRQATRSCSVRSLHMTGPATFPSPLPSRQRPAAESPKTAALFRAEGARKQAPPARSKPKAVHNSSVDFAHVPTPIVESVPYSSRVPVLPDIAIYSSRAQSIEEVDIPEPMRFQISTVSPETTHIYAPSALTDVTDNSAVDYQGLPGTAVSTASRSSA